MLLRIIKYNRPQGIIIIPVLMILLWINTFLNPETPEAINAMPLYEMLFRPLQAHPITSALVSMAVYVLMIILIIRFNIIHFLLEERTPMPAIFFIMLTATYPPALQPNPVLLSAPFLLIALLMVIRGDEHRADPMALFNASLILAAGSLFYLKILWFIPFLWITATIIRPLKWRGIINPILVLIMMLLFAITYYWVFRDDTSLLKDLIHRNLTMPGGRLPRLSTREMVLYGYLLILIIITSIHMLSHYQFRKNIIQKLYLVLFILFIYGILFYLFISGYRRELAVILALPLTYLFSNFFYRQRIHWFHDLLIWIWFGLIAWLYLAPLFE